MSISAGALAIAEPFCRLQDGRAVSEGALERSPRWAARMEIGPPAMRSQGAAQRRAPGLSAEPGRPFLTLALLMLDAGFVDAGVVAG